MSFVSECPLVPECLLCLNVSSVPECPTVPECLLCLDATCAWVSPTPERLLCLSVPCAGVLNPLVPKRPACLSDPRAQHITFTAPQILFGSPPCQPRALSAT
eukprot:530032-Pelagomonas_calceolata.AAC.3